MLDMSIRDSISKIYIGLKGINLKIIKGSRGGDLSF